MSDIENVKNMLDRANIYYVEDVGVETITLTIERGYIGFVTVMTFNAVGTFKDIGAYE